MMTSVLTQLRRCLLTLLLLAAHVSAFAQDAATTAPQMAEGLRANGKIYVVVLVLATIFAGIIAFLIYLERRLSRLEKDVRQPV